MSVRVQFAGKVFELEPSAPFTFGRDANACTVCLDANDVGISRVAGSISHTNGMWWVSNRSENRELQVIDETGLSTTLPPARRGAPGGRHAVDRPQLTVLVTGEVLTHALAVMATPNEIPVAPEPPKVLDRTPTHTVSLRLTDKQREALVALVEGYLLPFPRYDPQPRTYADAALRLGLRRSVVAKRIEKVRLTLVQAGVPRLEGEDDARRHLAEWVLSTRVITRADLDWLKRRRGEDAGDRVTDP